MCHAQSQKVVPITEAELQAECRRGASRSSRRSHPHPYLSLGTRAPNQLTSRFQIARSKPTAFRRLSFSGRQSGFAFLGSEFFQATFSRDRTYRRSAVSRLLRVSPLDST